MSTPEDQIDAVYPLEDWKHDLCEVGPEMTMEEEADERTIVAYAHEAYDDPLLADYRAHCLTRAFEFLRRHVDELVAGGFVGRDLEGACCVTERVISVLWIFLGIEGGLCRAPAYERFVGLLEAFSQVGEDGQSQE